MGKSKKNPKQITNEKTESSPISQNIYIFLLLLMLLKKIQVELKKATGNVQQLY